MIKAVIFDVDGVLLDSYEANLKFYNDLLGKFGFQGPSREKFREFFHHTMKDGIRIFSGSKSEEEVEKIFQAGLDREESPYPIELVSEPASLDETIEKLSKDYDLAIVTSRVRQSVYGIPQLAKLKKYFKVVVSYEDTKKHKPNPEPLILAAQKLGLKPEECIYIGDAQTDIVAAKSAGMKPVLFPKNDDIVAEISIEHLNELPELVKKL
jgi:pyrophosphatase PpaX